MKRLKEAQATLQAAIEENTRAIMFGDSDTQEAAQEELARVRKWFGGVLDDLEAQAEGMRRRVESFDLKWDDHDLGDSDVLETHHLLVTHNGSQWNGLSMSLTEMATIREFLTEKLVQEGVIPDPKLERK